MFSGTYENNHFLIIIGEEYMLFNLLNIRREIYMRESVNRHGIAAANAK